MGVAVRAIQRCGKRRDRGGKGPYVLLAHSPPYYCQCSNMQHSRPMVSLQERSTFYLPYVSLAHSPPQSGLCSILDQWQLSKRGQPSTCNMLHSLSLAGPRWWWWQSEGPVPRGSSAPASCKHLEYLKRYFNICTYYATHAVMTPHISFSSYISHLQNINFYLVYVIIIINSSGTTININPDD